MTSGHHPLFCILPPHMLREIMERGSVAQRYKAMRALETAEQIRTQRRLRTEVAALVSTEAVTALERAVYDAKNESDLPGELVRGEGMPPTGDPAVDEAYDGSGATYELFQDVYERNSIDDQGMRLDSTVHYQVGFDNAFWNGQQMVYGDGDEDLPKSERLFNRFTIDIGIIGHELTHGVTQHEANLTYFFQPGALNESMSDVFASLVKQRTLNQTAAEADWLVGAGLFTENVNGEALRSLKAPGTAYDDPVLGKDPQPAHMDDYKNVAYDNGGVHINSGIPNHAFYITAIEIGGFAWGKAGQIWYLALRDKLKPLSDFADAARLTHEAAGELYGVGSLEQQAVRTGWEGVGIPIDGEEDGEPQGCLGALLALIRQLSG